MIFKLELDKDKKLLKSSTSEIFIQNKHDGNEDNTYKLFLMITSLHIRWNFRVGKDISVIYLLHYYPLLYLADGGGFKTIFVLPSVTQTPITISRHMQCSETDLNIQMQLPAQSHHDKILVNLLSIGMNETIKHWKKKSENKRHTEVKEIR